ncbi:MAG: cytochrome c maturation protein CcmE [Rickettsiales bacterium]|jgi:cytochrome c-type biogenesis protein CcmE
MKPKHQRLLFIVVSMVFLCVGTLLTLRAFRDNIVFFYSPSDLQEQTISSTILPDKIIRIGGLVKAGSIERGDGDSINFIITDGAADIKISYSGMLPNLFRDGQGCIAEGKLISVNEFSAQKILAKHDEKYMPREVVDALKRSGNWHGEEAK